MTLFADCHFFCPSQRMQGRISSSAVQDAEKRLLLIPLFYLATHIWDTVLFGVVLAFPPDICGHTPAQLAVYNSIFITQVRNSNY